MNKYALILGANSDIAEAISRYLAHNQNYNLYLASRNTERLKSLCSDLKIRYGINSQVKFFDACKTEGHYDFYHSLNPKPELIIIAFGYLGDQEKAVNEWEESNRIIESNFTGAVSIVNIISKDLKKRETGCIVGISSVAGDRGRQSNFIYGSSKAGFTAYLSGLRNELFKHKVHVITVKPGFVQTKMIEGLSTPGFLTSTPERAAKIIVNAIKNKKNTIYILGIWKYIMLIIRNIPEFIFKRMKL